MKHILKYSIIALILTSPLPAVVISYSRIAYVDIERVFSDLNLVGNSRTRMQELIDERREEVRAGESEIESLKNRLEAEGDTLSSEELRELEKLIETHQESLREIMSQSREELLAKEEELRLDIMADIYRTVRKLSDWEGFSVIFERDSILYSRDSVEDITERIVDIINEEYK